MEGEKGGEKEGMEGCISRCEREVTEEGKGREGREIRRKGRKGEGDKEV